MMVHHDVRYPIEIKTIDATKIERRRTCCGDGPHRQAYRNRMVCVVFALLPRNYDNAVFVQLV